MLKQDCEEIDLRIALEAEESARSASEQEVVDLHKRAGKLDAEATELFDEAEQHQMVIDWYDADAETSEGDAAPVPIDVQLAQLRDLVKQTYKEATAKVCHVKLMTDFLKLCM